MDTPDIYNYKSFAEFMRALHAYRKQQKRPYSYRWMAKRIQLKSHAYLIRVAQGKFLPSPSIIEKIAALINLSDNQLAYARILVKWQAAQDPQEREFYLQKLNTFKRSDFAAARVSAPSEANAEEDLNTILEICACKSFRVNPEWITRYVAGEFSADEFKSALKDWIRQWCKDLSDAP